MEEILLDVAYLLAVTVIAIYVQMIIHEAGHLLFGKLSGYTFSSFRIGSVMWKKEKGKLVLRKMSIAGTGGQCLMVPPDGQEGEMPCVLYNLGGVLLNLITGVACIVTGLLCISNQYVFQLLFMCGFMGIVEALINGIPIRTELICNDGQNVVSILKSEKAADAFCLQLKMNEKIGNGIRLKEMPKEYFIMPAEEEMSNELVTSMGVFACNRLMDEHQFEEAKKQMEFMLNANIKLSGLYRGLLTSDLMYCELVLSSGKYRIEKSDIENIIPNQESKLTDTEIEESDAESKRKVIERRNAIIKKYMTKNQEKYMQMMQNYPGIIRTQYAQAVLAEQDMEKARQRKQKFENVAKTYPYEADIQSERELLEIIETMGQMSN